MSDLHFEFHRDKGRSFTADLDPYLKDVLIVAGDLGTQDVLAQSLMLLCARFKHVLFVPGNHEFYNSHRDPVERAMQKALKKCSNLHVMNRDIVEIDGTRFLGATLWFRQDPHASKEGMTDFRVIRNFEGWVYEDNAKSIEFFRRELRPGDVAISHHLPAHGSIAPAYKGHPLNPFFLCDVEDIIREKQPELWVHGHTHNSCDYLIGNTRVVCNPFGYAAIEENPNFKPGFTVEVGPEEECRCGRSHRPSSPHSGVTTEDDLRLELVRREPEMVAGADDLHDAAREPRVWDESPNE